jgi:hypothetical protein
MEAYRQTDLQDVIPNARTARVRNLLSRIAIPTRERLRFSLCISNTRAHSFLWCHSEGAHSAGEEPAFSRIRAVRSVDDREAIISKESEHLIALLTARIPSCAKFFSLDTELQTN